MADTRSPRKSAAAVMLMMLANATGAAAAPADDKIAQRTPEPFPGYSKHCGYPIISKRNMHMSYAEIDVRLGPVIALDPDLAAPAEAAHRRFLIAHECAHHKLGHTTLRGMRMRRREGGVEDQELSADCWAAERLVQAGAYDVARLMVERFYRKGLYSPGDGYPGGVQRSTVIYHCMRVAIDRENGTVSRGGGRQIRIESGVRSTK